MAYKAFYRKYRPTVFDQVIGQDHIISTLKNQVSSGQIGHAYLFTGSRGTGKTSVAKIFAKAINCKNAQNGSPCYNCDTCKALSATNNIDILEIDAASNNRVDEIREIREKVKFLPVHSKYKVYIIDEVHMLTEKAFNALLKTLEEPPSHVVFILATTEVFKLPATILSRCMRFDFRLVAQETLSTFLKSIFAAEGIEYDENSIKAISKSAEGSVRDLLSIADCIAAFCENKITYAKTINILGTGNIESYINLTDSILNKDIGTCLEIVQQAYTEGKNISMFSKDLTSHFRNLLIVKTSKIANKLLGAPDDIFEKYSIQAQKMQTEQIMEFMKIFSSVESELKYAISPKILLETAIITAITDCGEKKN